MLQWTFFVSNHVEPPLITLFRNRVFYPPEQRNASVADKAEDELRGSLQILEQELGRNQFFAGADWGMSDFMVACVLYVLTRLNLDLTAYPKLEAWLLASINRPAARSARKLREGDHSAFGVKRTWPIAVQMSAFDPKRTSGRPLTSLGWTARMTLSWP